MSYRNFLVFYSNIFSLIQYFVILHNSQGRRNRENLSRKYIKAYLKIVYFVTNSGYLLFRGRDLWSRAECEGHKYIRVSK